MGVQCREDFLSDASWWGRLSAAGGAAQQRVCHQQGGIWSVRSSYQGFSFKPILLFENLILGSRNKKPNWCYPCSVQDGANSLQNGWAQQRFGWGWEARACLQWKEWTFDIFQGQDFLELPKSLNASRDFFQWILHL